MSTEQPKKTFNEEFSEKIIAHLEAGTAPWQKPWVAGQSSQPPHNPITGTVYKGMNRVNLALSGYDDPRWMTLKQANDNGMRILSGSKSTPIVFFQFTKEQEKIGEDGKPEKETIELDKPIVRFARVFNAAQIDGMPPLEAGHSYDWNPVEKAENILAASGATIKHDQSDRAFYRSSEDAIHLPPKEKFSKPEGYGHWTRHPERMDREIGSFGSEQYAREELRAEISSWMLSQETGIPHDPEQHAAYVGSWIQALKEDPYEIGRACRDAEKIKDYIMDFDREMNLGKVAEKDSFVPHVGSNITQEKTFLAVPFGEKDQAKALGAKWDMKAKSWYVEPNTDLAAMQQWVPGSALAPTIQVESLRMTPQEEFAQTLADHGLDLGGQMPIMDGKMHRVPLLDRPQGRDGAYVGHLDGHPSGYIQNFVTSDNSKWKATGHVLSDAEKAVLQAESARKVQERQEELRNTQDEVAKRVATTLAERQDASAEHPYLQLKGVQPHGLKQSLDGKSLLVPLANVQGEIRSLQVIDGEGQKFFERGGQKSGCFHSLGDPSSDTILLAEGYATGASLHEATGKRVAVCFDAGNMLHVAKELRREFPEAHIVVCADNDYANEEKTGVNTGVVGAKKAAHEVGGTLVIPSFKSAEKTAGLSDFNDLHKSRGSKAVQAQVGNALAKEQEAGREA